MQEMCTLVYNDYDRISDKVMWLGLNTTLNFNVDLFYQRKDGYTNDRVKENFHREFIYKMNPNDISYRVKIVRDFSYYFSIEYNTKELKERIAIGPENIYFVLFNLKKVMQWFIGEDGINTVFSKKDGKLFIPMHPETIKINLSFGTYIEFEPAIELINGYETIGVKVYLGNDGIFFFMSSDVLFSLFHMLSTCNMYALAQNMLNYIGRPEYGTNGYNINTGTAINGSNKKNINKSSFFERVGAKSEN